MQGAGICSTVRVSEAEIRLSVEEGRALSTGSLGRKRGLPE